MAFDGPPKRGRMVPVPDASPTQPHARVRIPDAPVTLPSKPVDKGVPLDKSGKPQARDLWTFAYEGGLGSEFSAVDFTPIELPQPKPITLQFYQDTSLRGTTRVEPQPNNEWDQAWWLQPNDETPSAGALQLADVVTPLTNAVVLVSISDNFNAAVPFAGTAEGMFGTVSHVRMTWGVASFIRYIFSGYEFVDGTPDFYRLVMSGIESSNVVDPLDTTPGATAVRLYFESPQEPLEFRPNAAVRARVKYSAGKAENIQFECDWSGSLQLMASRVELSRVAVAADPLAPYEPQPVKLAAVALVNGVRPVALPTLTIPTAAVGIDTTVTVGIPPLARRVSLLALYGNEGAEGDIPLGQLFVAFKSGAGNALAYIDAMSAREALFGLGLPIPAGAVDLGLSNRSADTSVRLGVVWHLGV